MRKQKKKRAAQNKKKRWVEAKYNTSIYVTGLPQDITLEELAEFAKKCGMLRLDAQTGK
jgi:HIV Tat-specific factor 1